MFKAKENLYIISLLTLCCTNIMAKPTPQGWQLALGTGLLVNPSFKGSDEYQLSLLPYVRVNYSDIFFASMNEGIGFNLLNTPNWTAGPIARYNFGRKEKNGTSPFRIAGSKTSALAGLGDVDGTFEAGAFANYRFEPFDIEIEVRKGMGGHEGFVGDFSLSYSTMLFPLGYRTILSLGPRASIVSDDYNQAYYSIDMIQSTRSGLTTYNAQGGLLSFGLGASSIVILTKRLSMILFAGYDRLSGDAGKSPLVENRGSKNQFVFGSFLAYQFGS